MINNNKYFKKALLLFPLVVIAPLGLDICIPAITLIKETLGSSLSVTQWIISGFILCLSLGQLIFGPMVDRFGSKKIFIIGCILYITGALLVFIVKNISVLIILRIIQGIGASATSVAIYSCVPKLFKGNDIGKTFSLFNGVMSTIPVVAPIIGGILTLHYGWESSFYFLTIAIFLSMVLVLIKNPFPENEKNESLNINNICENYLNIIKNQNFKLGCAASSCGFASQLIFFSSSPIVIISQFSIPVNEFGFYFAINAIAITLGSICVSKLIGKVNESIILSWGGICLLIASLSFIFATRIFSEPTNIWGYIVPATIGSFGFALLMGASASIALSPFKALAGSASALMAATQMTFASIISWIVINYWESDWSTMTIGYLVLALLIAITIYNYKKRNQNIHHFDDLNDDI